MRVGQVGSVLGVSASWVRVTSREAERAGILPPVPRDRNGHRRYEREHVALLRKVLFDRREHPGMETVS